VLPSILVTWGTEGEGLGYHGESKVTIWSSAGHQLFLVPGVFCEADFKPKRGSVAKSHIDGGDESADGWGVITPKLNLSFLQDVHALTLIWRQKKTSGHPPRSPDL
jgi:hypothetical protein